MAHTHTHSERKPLFIPASATAEQMARTAGNFLDTLTPTLRQKAALPFDGNERLRWHYIPIEMWEREGVSLNELSTKQQEAAFCSHGKAALSVKGYQKARAIINLETTLGEIEKAAGKHDWCATLDSIFSPFSAIQQVTAHGDGVLKDTMSRSILPLSIANSFHLIRLSSARIRQRCPKVRKRD